MVGRTTLSRNSIVGTRVSSNGSPECKPGGLTIDWSLITAPVADVTLTDGSKILAGSKYIRYGQVLTKVTLTGVAVITISATGGTFTVTVTNSSGAATTAALAYNAAAATVQTAVQGLSNVGSGNATVSGSAGGPFTITFVDALGANVVTTSAASLTGGSGTAAVTTTAPGGNYGWFGPYDPAATDGRQTLTRGECFIADQTHLQYPNGSGASPSQDFIGAIEGGSVFWDRILQSGTATHTLALGPTKAEVLAAFPRLRIGAQN